jgi:4-hydroxyphenylpyruvate dioxygenase
LETGHRDICTHVVKNGKILIALTTPLNPGNEEFGAHMIKHGDGVRDVAFTVDNVRGLYEKAVARGAKSVQEPIELKDENGKVIMASIQTYGDTVHTLIQRENFTGVFLPGYKAHYNKEKLNDLLPPPVFDALDHCVGN